MKKHTGKKHINNHHHTIPRSRGGRQENTVEMPKDFHAAWHIVFGNLYGKECIEFIGMVNRMMEGEINLVLLEKAREKARSSSNNFPF